MKRFQFNLERVLRVRQLELDREERKMFNLQAELGRINAEIAACAEARSDNAHAAARRSGATGADLTRLSEYYRRLDSRTEQLRGSAVDCNCKLQEQRPRFVQARIQVRLLERLRSRRLEEWRLAVDRETEKTNAELFMSRWKAQSGRIAGARNEGGN